MKTRIISACVMLPLLIIVYLGGWFIWAAALVVAAIGIREFYKGFEAAGARPCYAIAYAAIALLYAANAFAPYDTRLTMIWIILITASMPPSVHACNFLNLRP